MKWEIEEKVDEKEKILCPRILDQEYIDWDFAPGSRFELCAVFSWTGKESLNDYQDAGVRPILYHKDLCTRHRIDVSKAKYGYCLFPAYIDAGILHIGNQKKSICTIVIPSLKQIEIRLISSFSIQKSSKYEIWEMGPKSGKGYYKIGGLVYSIPISKTPFFINRGNENPFLLYADAECKTLMRRII